LAASRSVAVEPIGEIPVKSKLVIDEEFIDGILVKGPQGAYNPGHY